MTYQPRGMPRVGAVIFDRDGTILDFYDMFHRFVVDLYREAGETPPGRAEILDYAYWESVTGGTFRIGGTVVSDRLTDVPLRYMRYGSLYPGTAEAIGRLAGRGIRVAVVSSWVGTQTTIAFLEGKSLLRHVASVVTYDDCRDGGDHAHHRSAVIKRQVLQIAMTRLGVAPSNSVVVGDSPDDIEAGRTLGARTAAVLTGNGARLRSAIEALEPTWILPCAADVVTAIDREQAA